MQESQPSTDVEARAYRATLIFAVFVWLLIFLPAGGIGYWQGWLFWAHFCAWSAAGTWYFLKRDSALVQRRLRAGPAAEREPVQKLIQLFLSVAICAMLVGSVLDHRFGWSAVPWSGVVVGNVLIAAGYWLVFLVLRENSFASSTIEIAADQRVIATGPYAIVRHPMYSAALLMLAGVPLALGSWWGMAALIPLAASLVVRLQDEEAYLARNLSGYDDYRSRVPWRLLPAVW